MNASDTILDLARVTDQALVHSPEWYRQLVHAVNDLIVHDFNGLVLLLYRLDISEAKIRSVLETQAGNDAADLIATLLLERQIEKIESRRIFKAAPPEDEAERW